jgi:hypothetical protein
VAGGFIIVTDFVHGRRRQGFQALSAARSPSTERLMSRHLLRPVSLRFSQITPPH